MSLEKAQPPISMEERTLEPLSQKLKPGLNVVQKQIDAPGRLWLREQTIIGRSDLRVRSVDAGQAESLARQTDPCLRIFCNTVEVPKLAYLACSVRRYSPRSRLMLLKGSRPAGFEDSLFHWVVRPSEGLEGFLDAISVLAVAA